MFDHFLTSGMKGLMTQHEIAQKFILTHAQLNSAKIELTSTHELQF